MNKVINVGVIDDDNNKSIYIKAFLADSSISSFHGELSKYSQYTLNVVKMELNNDMQIITENIHENSIDFLIIDYCLSNNANISYNGTELANYINDSMDDFPLVILTSYESDLYNSDLFSPYKVFSYERYMNDENERNEFIYKLIEEVIQYKKRIQIWENQLEKLLKKAGTSATIDEQILNLDDRLERCLIGKKTIPKNIKRDLASNKLDKLINELNNILEKSRME